ncbi:hypothetical protein NQ314_010260 [Rhamnusium bicolor]|uniref:PiggyBac transposable element-derived protein domain-containing protein n=1 Tax=Rhamnusium bicolor TaxID=1586634 RepID=A0AAV8XTG1_9CUCU|nr:hypothetical protein NQ314_010260 [Rhamnusium bicolor]
MKQTYSTGTLRLDRKNNPVEVKTAKVNKGERICRLANDVMVGKSWDKRDVAFIPTEFPDEVTTYCNKRNEEKSKLIAIFHYNKNMGGVDLQDQMTSYYPFSRKTLRWYKKLDIHIFQLLRLNAHTIYNKYVNAKKLFVLRLSSASYRNIVTSKATTTKTNKISFP